MFLNSLVRSRLTYGCHAWRPSSPELNKLDSTYRFFLRSMIFYGLDRVNRPPANVASRNSSESSDEEEYDWRYTITNEKLQDITKTSSIADFYKMQQVTWIAHVIRRDNDNVCKILTFHTISHFTRH